MSTNDAHQQTVPAPTRDRHQLIADLHDTGVAVVANAVGQAELAAARQRLVALASAERDAGTAILDDGSSASGNYGAGANQRVVSLIGKDPAFWPLALAPAPLDAAATLFGASYPYPSPVVEQYELDTVMLSSITANIASLGGRPMELHADQGFAPASTPFPLVLNVVWPLDDFTSDNGATRVVPGSHRDTTGVVDADPHDAVPVEAPAGSAILIDGRTWHGTGANRTPSPRHAVLTTYCRPWVRPFANHLLDIPEERLAAMPRELLGLLGARTWFVFGHSERARLDALR